MLRDDMEQYRKITGNDPNSISIGALGAFLDGYEYGEKDSMRWIPVTERLPEGIGHYLTTVESWSSYDKRRFVSIRTRDSLGWMNDDNIIAWMPLPEPYKEVEE